MKKEQIYYIPLSNHHIFPISSLDPESIKNSTKHVRYDREEIKKTTLLNAVSKYLGFKGGFSGYKNDYQNKLIPFLIKNGLKEKKDLIESDDSHEILYKLKRQDLSERLFFFQNGNLPKKVFTGKGSNFIRNLCGFSYGFFNTSLKEYFTNTDLQPLSRDPSSYLNNISLLRGGEFKAKIKEQKPENHQVDDHIYKLSLIFGYDIFAENNNTDHVTTEVDAKEDFLRSVLTSQPYNIRESFSFLNDNLFYPQVNKVITEVYPCKGSDEKIYNEIFNLFRECIDQEVEGWLEIIPFNDNLIFLKGNNGEYDFIFKNQRDKYFEHQIYGDNLKRKDALYHMSEEYRFKRWYYFDYQGFRYLDEHNAEKSLNLDVGYGKKHPGQYELLKSFYKKNGLFSFEINEKESSVRLKDFKEIVINKEKYMVSELVTIKDFISYIRDSFQDTNDFFKNYDKSEYDDFVLLNNPEYNSKESPVGVNWFNAINYISWFNKKNNVYARLLTSDEFSNVRTLEEIADDISCFDLSNMEKPSNLLKKINDSGFWKNEDLNISFVKSNYFAEWLQEETCIRTGSLLDFYMSTGYVSPEKRHLIAKNKRPNPRSLGRYKYVKIGFRMIYKLAN